MNTDSSPLLYEGEYTGKARWLGIKLVGTKSNRDAIGAVIHLKTSAGPRQTRFVTTGGIQSQRSLAQVFAVPEGAEVREVTIQWPSGGTQKFTPPALNKYRVVREAN